ncbi:MAG TPA: hypothetical protein VNO50_07745 [Pyrinomonadaceae bacterium]|nr:hypothetical protein [Pyrinomonadaceae bacterium]
MSLSRFVSKFVAGLCLFVALSMSSSAVVFSQEPTPSPSPTPQESPSPAKADSARPSIERAFDRLEWRSIGPANMGGRIADVEGIPGNPNVVYVATASGGLFKTVNAGITWKPLFERQGTISIGDIALAPSNPDVIWVGTGESNVRNSVSFGDGVYKSTDGGANWQHMGLRNSERISAIAIHPQNPDIVYVGALGHAFGPNEDRGVFMTIDGGKTWTKTLYLDREHGVSDLDIDLTNPNILYAGMWNFERKPWTHRSGSENGGVFKSIDGGRTWKRITNGLPKLLGRIGIRSAPSNPNVVYAIVESKEGTLYRSDDRGETFKQVSKQTNIVSRGFYYTTVRVDPNDENRVFAVASSLFISIDGGKTFRSITGRTHIDYHALWMDPKNPKRMWQGQDGGIAVSYDSGDTWEYVNNIPLGQFYQIHADNRLPFYYVMGGLQDNGAWTGPSRTREPAGIMNDDWRMVSFGDGFYVINNADDPELYISESQGGNILRTDFRTREQQEVNPWGRGSGDGPALGEKYRFNWNSPIVLSPHDKNTVYFGGNVVFRSTDFGKSWEQISADVTTNNLERLKDAGGPIAIENTSAEYYSTIISLAESPLQKGHVWVGTDDGNVQVTTDGGKNWNNLIGNVKGVPANSPVSHVEPSRVSAQTAYIAFDRHMFDDFRPYIYKTTDGGKSWSAVAGNLPAKAYVQVVREDPKNPGLLYAGTEIGLFASYTGGREWIPLNLKNMPNVAVHDIVVHPRENDLIVATHGRSVWILDDATPVQRMTSTIVNSNAHLFPVRPGLRFASFFTRYGIGDKVFTGPNPPYGALITYYLKDKLDDKATFKIQILDESGKLVQELNRPSREKGLNRVSWNLRYGGAEVRRPPSAEETAFGSSPRGPQVLPGSYTVKLTVGDRTLSETVDVRLDPTINVALADLQAQLELQIKLRDMQSATNTTLRFLDSVEEQLKHTETTIKNLNKEPDKELMKAIEDYKKQIVALEDRLVKRSEGLGFPGRSQITNRIGDLFFSIDGTNAAPTPYQRQYFQELLPEFRERMAEANRFIKDTIPLWNEKLRGWNAPTLTTRNPIDF